MATTLLQLYPDLRVQGPDLVLVAGRFTYNAGGTDFDLTVDGVPFTAKTTIVRDSAGTYTIGLPRQGGAYPSEMIACFPSVAVIDATDAAVDELNDIKYVIGSYDRTDGTFNLLNRVVTGSTAVAVGDLNDNSEVHFIALLRMDKMLAQTL